MSQLSPSVAALRDAFGDTVERALVSCGDTIVYVRGDRSYDVLAWLKREAGQAFDYLTDITAVE